MKRIPGITLIHDVEYLENGDLRFWQPYNIVPGKIHKKEDIDELYKTVTTPEGNNEGGRQKLQKISKDRPTEDPAALDASGESEAPPTTDESVSLEDALGGQDKCVSSASMNSLASLSLGNELAQAAADDANGTSLENGASSSGTANSTGTSTSFSGSDTIVSGCAFPKGPTGAELREVKREEG